MIPTQPRPPVHWAGEMTREQLEQVDDGAPFSHDPDEVTCRDCRWVLETLELLRSARDQV